MVVVGQAITDLISGPSFDFTFTIGPELDNIFRSRFLTGTNGGGASEIQRHVGPRPSDLHLYGPTSIKYPNGMSDEFV